MGMYTELVLNAGLTNLTPEVKALLTALVQGWSTSRHSWMLRTGSHYFVPDSTSQFITLDYTSACYLSIRTDLKNYDNDIDLFCDWVAPLRLRWLRRVQALRGGRRSHPAVL